MEEFVKHPRPKWYVVSTQSGQENKVKEYIEQRAQNLNLQDKIIEVVIAEEVVEVKRNNKPTGKTKIKNKYPRYIYVNMVMDDEAWFIVRNTPGVTGLVGSSGKGTKPIPVPKAEIDRVLKMVGRSEAFDISKYKPGLQVKVLKGSYIDQKGTILSVNNDTNEIEVEILMMGRPARGFFRFDELEILDA